MRCSILFGVWLIGSQSAAVSGVCRFCSVCMYVCVKCAQKEAKVLRDTRTWNSHKAIVEYTQIYINIYEQTIKYFRKKRRR